MIKQCRLKSRKIQLLETQELRREKTEEEQFHQTMQCALLKIKIY